MKKLFLLLPMAVVFCGNAQAQKGMQGIGVNGAGTIGQINSYYDAYVAFGGGLKYQYNISDYFRIEPSFTLYNIGEKNGFDKAGLINLDVFFSRPLAIRPYVFAGLGFVSSKSVVFDKHGGDVYFSYSFNDVGFDAGIGLDWRITHTWSVQIECGVLGGGMEACKFNIGLCYNL